MCRKPRPQLLPEVRGDFERQQMFSVSTSTVSGLCRFISSQRRKKGTLQHFQDQYGLRRSEAALFLTSSPKLGSDGSCAPAMYQRNEWRRQFPQHSNIHNIVRHGYKATENKLWWKSRQSIKQECFYLLGPPFSNIWTLSRICFGVALKCMEALFDWRFASG